MALLILIFLNSKGCHFLCLETKKVTKKGTGKGLQPLFRLVFQFGFCITVMKGSVALMPFILRLCFVVLFMFFFFLDEKETKNQDLIKSAKNEFRWLK